MYSYCSSMYSYCCLCILIVRPCILIVVSVFLLLTMHSYCCLCILIVRPCIFIVVYVFLLFVHVSLLFSMYSYFFYVFLFFVHVFLTLSMYTYFCLCILRRGYPDRIFLAFSSVVRQMPGITSQDGAQPALFQNCCVVLCIVFLYRSMYCLCVNVYYCYRVTTQLQLTNIS